MSLAHAIAIQAKKMSGLPYFLTVDAGMGRPLLQRILGYEIPTETITAEVPVGTILANRAMGEYGHMIHSPTNGAQML